MYDTAAVDALKGLVAELHEYVGAMHRARRKMMACVDDVETMSERTAIAAKRLTRKRILGTTHDGRTIEGPVGMPDWPSPPGPDRPNTDKEKT